VVQNQLEGKTGTATAHATATATATTATAAIGTEGIVTVAPKSSVPFNATRCQMDPGVDFIIKEEDESTISVVIHDRSFDDDEGQEGGVVVALSCDVSRSWRTNEGKCAIRATWLEDESCSYAFRDVLNLVKFTGIGRSTLYKKIPLNGRKSFE
jgi:hypothetical protein